MTITANRSPVGPVRTNARPGVCERPACRKPVAAGAGILDKLEGGRWVVYCRGCQPFQIPEPTPVVRELTAAGHIRTPYEPENLPLIRSFPGARWNAAGKHWTVSTEPRDRARVIELANRMGLKIAPELAVVPEMPAATPHGPVPAGKTLFGFQHAGVSFLAGRPRALLGDDMGTGKTVQALIALPVNAAALVICPACVKYNWRNEAAVWRPDLRVTICAGRGGFRVPQPGEIVIVNYDILPPAVPDGWESAGVSLIADEAHLVKNYKAARSMKVAALARGARSVWFLTGTPLLNRPFDLKGVLEAAGLDRDVFGGFGGFLRAFNGYKDRWGGYTFGMPEPWVAEKLRNVMLRRTKAEVLPDLPPKIYTRLDVNGLSAGLRRQLDAIWDESDLAVRDESDALPAFEQFSAVRAALAREKIPALLELAEQYEESETPLVVFSAHREPVFAVAERPGWASITGDTAPEARAEIVRRFQAGELKGVALTIAAGGVGLTLTRASTVVFVDLDWTPALNLQAEDRCHRIGQAAASLQIVRLVAEHPLERHVHDLLDAKQRLIAAAIDGAPLAGFVPRPPEPAAPGETAEEYAARRRAQDAEDAAAAAEAAARGENAARERARGRVAGFRDRERARAGATVPPAMTPELAESVRRAFGGMLAVCDGAREQDGAGFNKPDAFVAHVLLSAGLERPDETETAYWMLRRYPRQVKSTFPEIFA